MEPSAAAPAQTAAPAGIGVEQIIAAQNFRLAILAGIAAAIVGAVLWAVVTVVTNYEIGLMAVAVGFLVGRAIRETGKGIDQKFGYLGAICALSGCVVGNILSVIGFYAARMDIPFSQALLNMNPGLLIKLISAFFQPMDLLFYAIAVYEGYKFSIKYKLLPKQPRLEGGVQKS